MGGGGCPHRGGGGGCHQGDGGIVSPEKQGLKRKKRI